MTDPKTPNPLDNFRRAAKALKTGYDVGDADARARIRAHPPRADTTLKHADFLYVIARENRFGSWPAMKEAIETLGLDRAGKLQRLKIALHAGQANIAKRLVEADPDLATGHFGLLCGLYDVQAVWAMLTAAPTLAVTPAGPSLPLIHLCKSRMFSVWPDKADDAVAIADMLVANGACVNADAGDLSPLYWALGHAGNLKLSQWLLENGASPNDGESLYHATELGHAEGVKLLLAHGADPARTNALARALDFDNAEVVELLLKGGADANEGSDADKAHSIPALHQAARRMSSAAVLDLLLDHGADPTATWNGHSAFAFAAVFGNTELVQRIEARGQKTPLSGIETMLAVAATGNIPDDYIDPAKLPDAYRNILREILHLPNKLPHLKALVAIGLEWDRPDGDGVTPVQVAGWVGLPDVMAYFLKLAPDLSHVNKHGSTLLGAIIHGSEHSPTRKGADYVTCLRLALEHGVALPARMIEQAGDDDLRGFMAQWAQDKPGQVVAHGAA